MTTEIGRAFDGAAVRRGAAVTVAFAAVVLDWLAVRGFGRDQIWTLHGLRLALAVIAALALLALGKWDRGAFGFVIRPAPSVLYWVRTVALLGVVLGAVVAGTMVAIRQMGYRISTDSMFSSSSQFGPFVLEYCVLIVIFEEVIYRLVVCAPAVRIVGAWGTVVLSGVVFALLHSLYLNLLTPGVLGFYGAAGLLLGWAYLRSGSLLVSMALHALGNGAIGAYHAFLLYWEQTR